jgi:hypothetical protein
MNWLGKVFVVVILIMSLVFMGLSMAVYATHKNWKEVSEKLNKEVTQLKAEKESETSAHNRVVEDLTRERDTEKAQVIKAEAESKQLTEHNTQIQTELDGLKQNQREHIAAVASTQAINQTLAGEVGDLRQKIRGEQQTRDRVFKQALDATEQLNQAAGEYQSARERSDQLTKQVAGMTTVMKEKGIDPATDPTGVVPAVEGVVSGMKLAGGSQLVEVTIGSDDGLKTGNTLEVSRGDKYLGRLEVIQTSPDKAVARVDRTFQQGQIQEGDRVATRIKL